MPALDATLRRDITVDVRNENKTRIIVFMVVFSALTSAIVALRIASKLMQWGRLAWDDRLLLASLIQMLSMNILFVIGEKARKFPSLAPDVLTFFLSHSERRSWTPYLNFDRWRTSLFQEIIFRRRTSYAYMLRNREVIDALATLQCLLLYKFPEGPPRSGCSRRLLVACDNAAGYIHMLSNQRKVESKR